MKNLIYLDYNANHPVREEVRELMQAEISNFGNPSSGHAFGKEVAKKIEQYKVSIAKLLCLDKSSVFFVSSGTEANNMIAKSFDKNNTACLATDHPSITENCGIKLSVYQNGEINQEYKDNKNINLLSISHANNETGVMQNIEELIDYCQKYDIYFHLDASQSVGKVSLEDRLFSEIDAITISPHKFGGPLGIAILIINNKAKIKPLMKGGGQQQDLRAGTEAMYLIAGCAKALELAVSQAENFQKQCSKLQSYLESKVKLINKNIIIAGELAKNRIKNTSLIVFDNSNNNPILNSDTITMMLDQKNIAVSAGSACSYGRKESSYSLKAMGYNKAQQSSSIRISTSYCTKIEEIDCLLCEIEKILLSCK